jgi:hypothetical protein
MKTINTILTNEKTLKMILYVIEFYQHLDFLPVEKASNTT